MLNPIARLVISTHVRAVVGLKSWGRAHGKYINRHPCAFSIFISRIFIFIFSTQPCRTNWYNTRPFFSDAIGETCFHFLQNILGSVLDVLSENATIIILQFFF